MNDLCCCFGVRLEIVMDQGPGFQKDILRELEALLDVKHKYAIPYYPIGSELVSHLMVVEG